MNLNTKEKIAIISMIVTGVAFIGGLKLIFSSAEKGENYANNQIEDSVTDEEDDTSIDVDELERNIIASTDSFRTIGLSISLVGGFGFLISGYTFYNQFFDDSVNQKN